MSGKEKKELEDFLKPDNMIRLYAIGAFPMADNKSGTINWYLPEIRCIIPLDNFNIPRSTRKAIEKQKFEIHFDHDPMTVIKHCADRKSTWISDDLIKAYKKLYHRGYIHSVEVYKDNELVGGLYGVTFRGAFFGESMFSKVSQSSKAALINLIQHLRETGFALLDVQYLTEHLKMFGAVEISKDEYSKLLEVSYERVCTF